MRIITFSSVPRSPDNFREMDVELDGGARPDGMVLVHNHVRPAQRSGTRGFRFWLQPPQGVVACSCGWRPELEHKGSRQWRIWSRYHGAFPIRRARIVAARLDTYRPSSPTASTLLRAVGDAIAAYSVCRSSICPSDHVFHPFAASWQPVS
jgi:hypothetical protein